METSVVGEFGSFGEVHVENKVVHTYPASEFDGQALNSAVTDIHDLVKPLDNWVLYEHVNHCASLTTTGLKQLLHYYENISSHGCIGIGVHIDSIYREIVTSRLTEAIEIPILISQDPSEINAFIETLLTESSAQN